MPQAADATSATAILNCFPPVCNSDTRILILGSLPGVVSLTIAQYYGHPQNAFWKLMSEVVGADLRAMTYEARLRALLAHGVGLWDVVAEAQRKGSLDSNIVGHTSNDLPALIESLPLLHTIAFNGGTAAKLGIKALKERADKYRILMLPSSSPAYTLAYAEKLAQWSALKV
ncbi:DNA-deoxyinosine glycosylase [Herbaspirillum lusitanum]|uniref:DNA-deoxyinosine glycosylase n=1 Tax=Herbaspirillum lusitanum TaxID=213312 RepID=A0ABW9A9F0_9BURK